MVTTTAIDLTALRAAIAHDFPAGKLGTVKLPTLISTTGAVVHSREYGRCGELRAWGGMDADGMPNVTLVELAQHSFVNDDPEARICDTCYGEDVDDLEDLSKLLVETHQFVLDVLAQIADAEDAADDGDHRLSAKMRAQSIAWQRIGAIRADLEARLHPPGQPGRVQRWLARADELNPDLAARLRPLLAEYTDDCNALVARMRADRDDDDRAAGVSLGPDHLFVPRPDGPSSPWRWTSAPVGRWANVADRPVGWIQVRERCLPAFSGPYDQRAARTGEISYLGEARALAGPPLAAQLAVAERLMREALPNTPLTRLEAAFEAAVAVTSRTAS